MTRVYGVFLFLKMPTVMATWLMGINVGIALVYARIGAWINVALAVGLAVWAFSYLVRHTEVEVTE